MESERRLIIKKLKCYKETAYSKKLKDSTLFIKDCQRSIKLRKKGNELYGQKNHNAIIHEEIWKLYTESIAFALNDSEELASSYANRSALLLHLQKYKDCLKDINRALKITESKVLKIKLYCRQTECYVAIQDGNQRLSFLKAKHWLDEIEDAGNTREILNKLVKKTEVVLEANIAALEKDNERYEIRSTNDGFRIGYDEKHGRHLIATRDIHTGEIVCVEKFYVASVNNTKKHAYCSHCLAISWSLIPCGECAFYMFCSEECREEAWKKYHEIECLINLSLDSYSNYRIQMSVRSVLMGLREAGGLDKLREMIDTVEYSSDNRTKGFSDSGKFLSNSFRSLFSLNYSQVLQNEKHDTKAAVFTLIKLSQTTSIFGRKYTSKHKTSLIDNEDVIFIGSLLLRLIKIFRLNAFDIINTQESCKKKNESTLCAHNRCCPRGMSFSPIASLMNHNCNPNVLNLYCDNGKVVYYAVRPIKKNSQIFSSYYCHYFNTNRFLRQKITKELFEFDCDCIACEEDWPGGYAFDVAATKLILGDELPLYDQQYINAKFSRHRYLIDVLKKLKNDENHQFNENTVRKFAKDTEKFLKNVVPPSHIIHGFLTGLIIMFESTYSTRLKIPEECKSSS